MPRSSSASASGLRRSERRSTSSSRSISSRCAVMERYSPAAMEKDPATRPAMPASRTIDAPELAPAMPRTNDTLVTRPSLMPKTAARAPPPRTSRCWCTGGTSCSCEALTGVSVVRRLHAGSVPLRNRNLTSEERPHEDHRRRCRRIPRVCRQGPRSSEWVTITQERVNLFADATDDHQWIHVDPERAKEGPFGARLRTATSRFRLLPSS